MDVTDRVSGISAQKYYKSFTFIWIIIILLICGCYGIQDNVSCPSMCVCEGTRETGISVDCTAKNLTTVPQDIDVNTVRLDLSMNNLTSIPERAFSKLRRLEVLTLVGNRLSSVPSNAFAGLFRLTHLFLQDNLFEEVPRKALRNLRNLQMLYLDANRIKHVPDNSFKTLQNLKQLRLDANQLTEVPVVALNQAKMLEAVDLAVNQITEIPDYAFVNLSNLIVLMLSENKISKIGDHAFEGLPVLPFLELNKNRLTKIPTALQALPDLFDFAIMENQIEYLPDYCFRENKKLTRLRLKDNPITAISKHAFSHIPALEELELSEAHDVTEFPDLTGTTRLTKIILDRASITSLPANLCDNLGQLKIFDVHSNRITLIPNMTGCKMLTLLNFGNNEITSIDSQFRGLDNLKDLTLKHNRIESIPNGTFQGLTKLEYLDLSYNRISFIAEDAFVGLSALEDLNLGENKFPVLPTRGLENLRHLKTFHNKQLLEPPPYDAIPKIQTLALAYAYHCCAFIRKPPEEDDPKGAYQFKQVVKWLRDPNTTGLWPPSANYAYPILLDDDMLYGDYDDFEVLYPFDKETIYDNENMNSDAFEVLSPSDKENVYENENMESDAFKIVSPFDKEHIYDNENMTNPGENDTLGPRIKGTPSIETMVLAKPPSKPPVDCQPMPGPFLPCDDLFGWWSLRCGVWIVFLLAVLGNGTVLFVSVCTKSKMDVTRFLICNLACSDLCMGAYLGFLAIVDASTLGEFEKYAVRWQSSPGCLVAGFLGVLSSELSVFTLTVITVERFYAISHAMQLDRRLRLRHASYIMMCGWLLCLTLASLPLFEISDYRVFAICLPFDTEQTISLAYVCFIMVFNACSFLVIVCCYIGMYIYIRRSHSWNSKDTVVAKRMALLVFTDFFCWAPIIFFSITAAFESNFARISLDESKVLTIFVLPLNSCANPFLYAFFTRQFKKDCVKLCKRIEESSLLGNFQSNSSRRASVASNRQSQNNTFNVEKRGSSSRSVEAESSSGDAFNNPSDSDITLKKVHFTCKQEPSLQYVRSDSGIYLTETKSSVLSDASPSSDQETKLLSNKSNPDLLTEDSESGPDIVLHTDEGHVFLNTSSKGSSRKVRQRKMSTLNEESIDAYLGERKREGSKKDKRRHIELKAECHKLPDTFIYKDSDVRTIDSRPQCTADAQEVSIINSDSKVRCENGGAIKKDMNKVRNASLDSEPFKRRRHKRCRTENEVQSKRENDKSVATQTDLNGGNKSRDQTPCLPGAINKRDRHKEINEWRKTSHLTFLWRKSDAFDTLVPEQKSNSLVELTRPVRDLKDLECKRHSLTSRHEGYILLKNGSRDSAYEDDDLYEFQDGRVVYLPHAYIKKEKYTGSLSSTSENSKAKKDLFTNQNSVFTHDCCETTTLLSENEKTAEMTISHRKSCDDESGISCNS